MCVCKARVCVCVCVCVCLSVCLSEVRLREGLLFTSRRLKKGKDRDEGVSTRGEIWLWEHSEEPP